MSLHVEAHIGGAVEVAVRLMCAPAVVVEDVGACPVCGSYQKFQTNQLFEKLLEVGDGAGDQQSEISSIILMEV